MPRKLHGHGRATLIGACMWLGCHTRAPVDEEGGSAETTDSDADTTTTTGEQPNTAPSAPLLLSPADGAVSQPLSGPLCWQPAVDAEGDALRYRVWVDDVELVNGKLGEDGFTDTCTGTLDWVPERTYGWRVQAVELDDPSMASPDSETWRFTTGWDGDSKILLSDDFSSDQGWTVDGDALTGAWVRGDPRIQPTDCFGGSDCFFTGNNPDAIEGEADVDGGSVVLTSPPFDASGATSLSVSLARWFHRSDLVPTGVSLEVALLDGVTAHVLEKLDGGPEAELADTWTAVAYPACGIELGPDMRLRITASDLVDPEAVIVEAAIDDVLIEGYTHSDVCMPGLGALCDPDDPEPACGAELLCCAQGPIFDGVYRCEAGVPELGDAPPPNPGDPLTGPLGCDAPDLVLLDDDLQVENSLIFIAQNSCSLYEGCVNGTGWRRVLRFDTKSANIGSRDLVLGVAANHPDLFHYSQCHAHHHFDDYANYELLDGDQLVAVGHKQAFCLVDWDPHAWPQQTEADRVYSCFNQGLSLGWSDTYFASIDCQWIDVTTVLPGAYTLRMQINVPPDGASHPTLVERRYDNNVLEIPVVVE